MRGRRSAGTGIVAEGDNPPPIDPIDLDELTWVARAADGDLGAFDQLYRRHSEAAWRVAQSVAANPDDAADAVAEAFTKVLQAVQQGRLEDPSRFRPYLLSATRNVAIDGLRRNGRLRPTDLNEPFETAALSPAGPSDRALDALDASLVASAFRSLPERWRSVLWLTEVEGMPAREAADLLGVSANGAAQLAVRARAGLRERFLQAHLQGPVDEDCRFTVERLGAYVGGGLAARELAKVDQHLAACDTCRARQAELEDLGHGLRRAALPLPLGLAALALNHWKRATSAAATASRPARGVAAALGSVQRPLLAVSLGMLGLGIVAAAVMGQPAPAHPAIGPVGVPSGTGASAAAAPITSPPVVTFKEAAATDPGLGAGSVPGITDLVPPSAPLNDTGSVNRPVQPAPASPPAESPVGSTGPTSASPAPPPAQAPVAPTAPGPTSQPVASAGVAAVIGPVQTATSATADPSCTGATTGTVTAGSASVPGQTAGCSVPPPATTSTSGPATVTVSTSGSLVGSNTIQVP